MRRAAWPSTPTPPAAAGVASAWTTTSPSTRCAGRRAIPERPPELWMSHLWFQHSPGWSDLVQPPVRSANSWWCGSIPEPPPATPGAFYKRCARTCRIRCAPSRACPRECGGRWRQRVPRRVRGRLPSAELPPGRPAPKKPSTQRRRRKGKRQLTTEFWNLYDGNLTVKNAGPALAEYQRFYNHVRPHYALDLMTPMEYLLQNRPAESGQSQM